MKVLLSIKPEYAEKILNGEKRFEFRKSIFRNERVCTVVIYATMPVGKVIGEFRVSSIIEARPSALWKRTSHAAGISEQYFKEYFAGRTRAYAIGVDQPKRYKKPIELSRLIERAVPPQSFCYV
ncbi:putative transcriptional regulator [Povalibacter uvarum]|uniref:Putative transcriptional regulator n=1 Tax=Povalibacter uvarum TaxID=732238 RepID=A0A841HUH0_9GAMM|nr:ASCH domain-containing protein [Povalibacter uvarum]MBB6095618.1 putative transcriptional regulator [Povalibacter uvarum]